LTRPPAIWLGDALRAAVALQADPDTTERIWRLLDLLPAAAPAVERPPPVRLASPAPPPSSGPAVPPGRLLMPPPARTVVARAVAVPQPAPADLPTAPTVEREEAPVPRAPKTLPSLAEVLEPAPPRPRPDPADLFRPDRQRALLTALCSGPAPTGEPDIEAAVEIAARGEPLLTLPAEIRPTTRRGLQLLVDQGEAMLPFARDQEQVRRTITLLAGPDGFEVVQFARTPLDPPGAGIGPMWTWRPYRPQLPGQPVLVLSDLGALSPPGDRPDVEDGWRRFAALLHEAGCPLVALVPAPRRRLSARLRSVIAVVPWDRPTGVRDAAAAARRAGGRLQRGPA